MAEEKPAFEIKWNGKEYWGLEIKCNRCGESKNTVCEGRTFTRPIERLSVYCDTCDTITFEEDMGTWCDTYEETFWHTVMVNWNELNGDKKSCHRCMSCEYYHECTSIKPDDEECNDFVWSGE